MSDLCKNCIHYKFFAYGTSGKEKAVCQYRESMIYTYTKACKKHYEESKNARTIQGLYTN